MKTTMAKEFMTKNPVTLHHGTTIWEALETFKGTKFRVLPVVDDNTHVLGVVNLEDLGYIDIYHQEISLSESVMHKATLVDEKTSLGYIGQFMMENQQDHVFVIDKKQDLIGVISGIDVVKKILELMSS
jgi:CBS domain-containing protein